MQMLFRGRRKMGLLEEAGDLGVAKDLTALGLF